MMALLTLIPLLLVIFLIVMIAFFTSSKKDSRKSMISGKKMHLILGGYVTLLVLSMIVYYLVPTDTTKEKLPSTERYIYNDDSLFNRAQSGDFNDIDASLKKGSWSFDYEGETLNIAMNHANDNGTSFVVTDRKEDNDGIIDVKLYSEPYTVNDVDITSDIGEVDISVRAGELFIEEPVNIDLIYAQFLNPFVYSQFTGEDFWSRGMSSSSGVQLIYLEIPNDLEVTTASDQTINVIKKNGN